MCEKEANLKKESSEIGNSCHATSNLTMEHSFGTKMAMCRMGPKDANTNPTQKYRQHTQNFQFGNCVFGGLFVTSKLYSHLLL